MAIYLNPNQVPDMMHEISTPVVVDELDVIWNQTQEMISKNPIISSPSVIADCEERMQKFADINEKIESSFARILEEREADPLDLCFHLMLLSSGPLIQLKGRS